MKCYTPRPEDVARANNDFTFHAPIPDSDQTLRYERIREMGRIFALELLGMCPTSRELSLALTNLDQVVFWSNAAIARNER